MFARWSSEASYRRSQRATGVPVRPTPIARGLTLRVLDAGDNSAERQRVAQLLVDELSREAGLPPCQVVVPNRRSSTATTAAACSPRPTATTPTASTRRAV